MTTAFGISALAVAVPETVRLNDYWRNRYPEVVAKAEEKTLARLFAMSQPTAPTSDTFDGEMKEHLADPFRGTVERRVLNGRSSLSLELEAARSVMKASGTEPGDIDLLINTAFSADHPGIGHGTFLVRDLGLSCPGWNIESACSSSLVALETAGALVQSGRYRKVLMVLSCSYSRDSDEADTLSWFMGDAAGAYIVTAQPEGYGVLGQHTVNTVSTCGTFRYDMVNDPKDGPKFRLACSRETQRILRETSEEYVRVCCEGAMRAAGVSKKDIRCFVFNTPTAWFGAFACKTIGISPSQSVNTYPRYGNIGPALTLVNLHEAATTGKFSKDDLVLVYSIGSVSTASAAVMRWGEVALGPIVPKATVISQ